MYFCLRQLKIHIRQAAVIASDTSINNERTVPLPSTPRSSPPILNLQASSTLDTLLLQQTKENSSLHEDAVPECPVLPSDRRTTKRRSNLREVNETEMDAPGTIHDKKYTN